MTQKLAPVLIETLMSEIRVKNLNNTVLQDGIVGVKKQFFYMKILYYTICKLNTSVQLNEFHIIIRYFTISSTFLRGYLYSKWSKTKKILLGKWGHTLAIIFVTCF